MFQTLDYPITGDLKIFLLMVEWIIAFLFLEFAIVFLFRIKSKEKDTKIPQEKAIIYMGFGYSLMWIFRIVGDYYIEDSLLRSFYFNLSLYSLLGGGLAFVYTMEKYKLLYFKRYHLTLSFFVLYVIFIVFTSISHQLRTPLALTFVPFLFIYFVFFLKKLKTIYFKKEEFKKYRISSSIFLIGMILLFFGYILSTDLMRIILSLDLNIRMIGDNFQIAGVLLLAFFLIYIPSFSEFDWRKSLDGVLIMHRNGLPIFRKFYVELQTEFEGLITGILTTVKLIYKLVIKQCCVILIFHYI